MQGLRELLSTHLKITLSDEQLRQFQVYFDFLNEFNQHTNLTRIDPKDIAELHFYDSLVITECLKLEDFKSLIDVGTGAGFPGVPLKIVFPHLQLTLLDSKQKKVNFLNQLIEKLSLTDSVAIHGRAEDLSKLNKYAKRFDVVTARAVSETKELVKLLTPFKSATGSIVLYKGPKTEEEIETAKPVLNKLKLKVVKVHQMQLPVSKQNRALIILT